jgi:hypothetical protein
MGDWNLTDYKYNAPYFQHDYPRKHHNPNYHWGYDHLPTYTDMPLPPYEQQLRAEQKGVPARIICDCGNTIPLVQYEGAHCHKCNKDWSHFVGGNKGNDDTYDAKIQKERHLSKENFANLSTENSLFIILVFIFLIFVSCMYVHISTMSTKILHLETVLGNRG